MVKVLFLNLANLVVKEDAQSTMATTSVTPTPAPAPVLALPPSAVQSSLVLVMPMLTPSTTALEDLVRLLSTWLSVIPVLSAGRGRCPRELYVAEMGASAMVTTSYALMLSIRSVASSPARSTTARMASLRRERPVIRLKNVSLYRTDLFA
jgi:hypothetical protein